MFSFTLAGTSKLPNFLGLALFSVFILAEDMYVWFGQ